MAHKKHKPLPSLNAGNTIRNNFSLLKDLRKYYGNTTATIRNSHESSVTIPIASLGMSIKTNSFYMLTKSDGVQMPKDLADKFSRAKNKEYSEYDAKIFIKDGKTIDYNSEIGIVDPEQASDSGYYMNYIYQIILFGFLALIF